MTAVALRTEIMKHTDKVEDNVSHRKKMTIFSLSREPVTDSLSKRNNLASMLITGIQPP